MIKALLVRGEADSLRYLDNDIKSMKNALQNINVEVEQVKGDKHVVLKKLDELLDQLGSTDTLIIYYTGHGYLKKGKIAFKLEKKGTVSDFVSVDEILISASEAKTDSIVLIFDCCYASATETAWRDYADDTYALFLPSNKLEPVEELEEFQSSFFTYCICDSLESKDGALYKENKITLENLYNVVNKYVYLYNKNNNSRMPIPELYGARSKEITIGYKKQKSYNDIFEEKVRCYLGDFIYCIEKCDQLCNQEQQWCSTIFKSDANIFKYVIPSVKEFISRTYQINTEKLDAFFDNWFEKQEVYLGILGDMGVGKTTACVYLFYYLAIKYMKGIYTYVPVYISLNALNECKAKTIYSLIRSFMNPKFTIEGVKQLCSSRRMVFILDGFDEISGDSSTATILKNYTKLKPFMRFGCKTILTCRTHYFSEQEQLEEVLMGKTQGTDFSYALLNDEYPFNVVELQEFSEDEILELIKLLLPEEDNQKIWGNIREIYDLQDLAKRAILLKMIVRTMPELQKKNQKVDSALLYFVYTKKILRREIETRKIGLELSEKERFIGYIANLMFVSGEMSIGTEKFDKEIKEYFKDSLYSKNDLNNYNYDCKVSTFFSRDRQDNYRFMHKSFYEYYFALHCIMQMSEGILTSWSLKWFPREIACFIKELLGNSRYTHLIPKIMQTSLATKDEILIWNTLHILSLLDKEMIQDYFTDNIKEEYIKRGKNECKSVIIRQYCRIIAKFIDRKSAEDLIDKIICIVRANPIENENNDQTYYNYYGGKNSACQAFIRHLSVDRPKYDAKLHLYLLEHIAPISYSEKIKKVTDKWVDKYRFTDAIEKAIVKIEARNIKSI